MGRYSKRVPDIREVYDSSWTPNVFRAAGREPRLTFEEWIAEGCPSFLDYGPDEQAVVDAYLNS